MADFNNHKDTDLTEKFDFTKKVKKQTWYIKMLAWVLSFSSFWFRKQRIEKMHMEGLKPPYVLLVNHNAFLDFKVTTKALFPHGGNNVVAIDGFIHREGLLRAAGCIAKRKFTNDMVLIRQLLHVKNVLKEVIVLYPEARYSLVGTNEQIPDSLGKLMKLLKIPVVTLITKGHHIDSPVWNLKPRNNRIEAEMRQIVTQEEVDSFTAEEINSRINQYFVYDDYKWQKENNVKITYPKRAEGLHKVLYKCPSCKTEHRMVSAYNKLSCEACEKTYELNVYNELKALNGETEFSHIPDWYNWEREEVKKEILRGEYRVEDLVDVDSLPNAKGFIHVGEGKLVHDANGFVLEFVQDGTPITLTKDVSSMYSCHIEYDYNNKGDCIDLSTLEDTYYLYFKNLENIVTKIHFATEELYKLEQDN